MQKSERPKRRDFNAIQRNDSRWAHAQASVSLITTPPFFAPPLLVAP